MIGRARCTRSPRCCTQPAFRPRSTSVAILSPLKNRFGSIGDGARQGRERNDTAHSLNWAADRRHPELSGFELQDLMQPRRIGSVENLSHLDAAVDRVRWYRLQSLSPKQIEIPRMSG